MTLQQPSTIFLSLESPQEVIQETKTTDFLVAVSNEQKTHRCLRLWYPAPLQNLFGVTALLLAAVEHGCCIAHAAFEMELFADFAPEAFAICTRLLAYTTCIEFVRTAHYAEDPNIYIQAQIERHKPSIVFSTKACAVQKKSATFLFHNMKATVGGNYAPKQNVFCV